MHKVIALAGGVGGAKLVFGLSKILKPQELSVVVNTADDDMFHGLHVSPDVDTVMYALAGLTNKTTGWGRRGYLYNIIRITKIRRRYLVPTRRFRPCDPHKKDIHAE